MTATSGAEITWTAIPPDRAHPLKIAIIEALWWIEMALSARELQKVFLGRFPLSSISYHLVTLAKLEVLEKVGEREVRGATQTFYFFPASMLVELTGSERRF